jgi:phosphoglycerate dehydrogenase-like enzyme
LKKRLRLLISVTKDKRVHKILEKTISRHRVVSAMFARLYVSGINELRKNIRAADVLFSFAVPDDAIANAENLKWLHFASAGVEKSLNPTLLSRKIKISCSRGIHATTISEYVLMQILVFAKNLRQAHDYQKNHRWDFEALLDGKFDLAGKTVCIIGLGSIGQKVAKLAKAFGMHVVGTVNERRKLRFVDEVYGPTGLRGCLAKADFAVLAVPLTPKTFHLISSNELSLMKNTAFIVNIGRGRLIDEKALVKALKTGAIAGAALDVFENEPLPPASPLWSMANVSVTPHYAGMAEDLWEKVALLFCENAIRYHNGKRLLGMVNRQRGY